MLKPGDSFPSTCIGLKNRDVDLRDRFLQTAGILIGSIGAFHPVDTSRLIPGYKNAAGRLKESGVGFIACLAVNDPYVLRAWARRMKVITEMTFISDVNALLSQALGVDHLMPSEGFGNVLPRCQRFAMLVGKGGTVLAVAKEDEAFSEKFLPQVFRIMKTNEEGAMSEEIVGRTHNLLSVRQSSDISTKSAASQHPLPPRLLYPAETWYPASWLLPFKLLYRNCINDTDNEHIVFEYSQSSLCDSYMLKRIGGRLELSPNMDDDFGSVIVDYMRPVRAVRRMRLANAAIESTVDESCDLRYNIKRVIITSQEGLVIETPVDTDHYAEYNYGLGTTSALIVVIHELAPFDQIGNGHDLVSQIAAEAPKHLVVVFGLHAGGRDPLLANVKNLLPMTDGQQITINRKDLAEQSQGLGVSQYVAARDRFYSFKHPLPFELTDNENSSSANDAPSATWFVAAERAYASEVQLRALKSLYEQSSPLAPLQDNARSTPDLMFFTACDCQ